MQALNTRLVLANVAPRIYHFGMATLTKFRERAGLSQARLADLVGTSQPQIQRLEKGKRGLSRKWALRIAPHVGAVAEELMFGDRSVSLVGHVGAGSEAHFYAESDQPFGRAKMPPGGSESTVAVQVRGDSLGGPLEGWVIYYDERRDPPTSDLLNQLCVIGLPGGKVLVKKLMRGRTEGRFDLWSLNGSPIIDAQVEWAALVIAMVPASRALVEDSQEIEPTPPPNHKKKITRRRIIK